MDFSNFENASEKQIEAMLLIMSEPEGKDLTYKKAAEKLGINESAFIKRIYHFKNNCPKTWDEIKKRKKTIKEGNSRNCLTDLFCTYRNGAEKRGFSFEFTKEQFGDLTKQDCWYCGAKPVQKNRCSGTGKSENFYLYNGIDRVENDKGYTLANSLPCCGRCNKMKMSLSVEDFINQVKKIVLNLGLTI